jgi:hypothetical protein
MAISWRPFSPQCTRVALGSRRKKIGAASLDTAPICAMRLPKGSDRYGSTSLLDGRAELHRLMPHFLAAGTECNGSDHRRYNDSALHGFLLLGLLRGRLAGLLGDRQVGAELHGLMPNFPTASREGNSRNHRRDHDDVLDVHVFSPKLRQTHRY